MNLVFIPIITLIVLILTWIIIPKKYIEKFFGKKQNPAEILKYIGVIVGSIIVICTLYNANETNNLTRKGQLDNRFIEASKLLSSENNFENISGVYTLNRIAKEASSDKSQKGYTYLIKEILFTFLRENSEPILKNDILVKVQCKKKKFVFQQIINILFDKENDFYMYSGRDLSSCSFSELSLDNFNFNGFVLVSSDFSNSNLEKATFDNSTLLGAILFSCYLKSASLKNVELDLANLELANLLKADVSNSNLCQANMNSTFLDSANLSNSNLIRADLRNALVRKANLSNTNFSFADLRGADFTNAILLNTDFSYAIIDKTTIFKNTKLEKYPISKITEFGNSKKLTNN